MSESAPNPLIECGKPLFFPVASPSAADVQAPPIRLGDAVRVCVRSLSVMQKEALVVSARTGAVWRLASDEGAYLAGLDEAPCPLAFVTTGMVSAYMNEITALARQRSIRIDAIRLVQDNYYTMSGSARAGTMTGGAKDVRLTAQIAGSADTETWSGLVAEAAAASPLNGMLRGSQESLFTLTHNGAAVDIDGAAVPGAALPDPRRLFAPAVPAAPRPDAGSGASASATVRASGRPSVSATGSDSDALIRRGGTSPKVAHTVTLANDSLAEQQNRLLHVRGICTLRDDGVKQIEQQLFNPHGSIFHFLCDEAPEAGGRGLAPDAASYFSAGIGFCFMTQIGRYAKILGKDLRDYRIVQDTHFSLGGASGGTGEAGTAAPVETHVHLDSGEDDAFARAALVMAEQTCFLHALCRTDVRTRISVLPWSDEAAVPAVAC